MKTNENKKTLSLPTSAVYIVEKVIKLKVEGIAQPVDFTSNEGVFNDEGDANEYIRLRKALKDRDDRGCTFKVTPWGVQNLVVYENTIPKSEVI